MDEKDLERTVTINISKAGCFLFSGRAWTKYPTAWFIITRFAGQDAHHR